MHNIKLYVYIDLDTRLPWLTVVCHKDHKICYHTMFQVTGANKGVGFGCVRGLCKQFDGDVYLTGKTFYAFETTGLLLLQC